jgi:protein-S-isoprenylcysteine O-methyltransferase Ste14
MSQIAIIQYAGRLVVLASYFVFAVVLLFHKREPKTGVTARDSTAILGLIVQIIPYFIVWQFERNVSTLLLPDSVTAAVLASLIAGSISIASVVIVMKAVQTLSKQWSLNARVVERHKLIVEGPYRFVRHPIYTGMFGLVIATGLAFSRPWAILLAIAVYLIGYYIRITAEERLLSDLFKDEFEQYRNRVPGLLPNFFRNVSRPNAV